MKNEVSVNNFKNNKYIENDIYIFLINPFLILIVQWLISLMGSSGSSPTWFIFSISWSILIGFSLTNYIFLMIFSDFLSKKTGIKFKFNEKTSWYIENGKFIDHSNKRLVITFVVMRAIGASTMMASILGALILAVFFLMLKGH